AEAHDFSGLNNANMFTPADGASPRQQMYLWSGPQRKKLTVNSPAGIAGDYSVGVNSTFGPQGYTITGDVVLVNDGSGSPTLGCNPITNDVTGKIALIDRGTCGFVVKVKNAQNAGAIGVIIANNGAGTINMGGTDATITIGALMVSQADGNTIKGALAGNTVNVTLFREDPTGIIK